MSVFSDIVRIVEVGPRDGLQNEKTTLSVEDRVELIRNLIQSGLRNLEGGGFVSPKAIPQMIDSEKVWSHFQNDETENLDLSFLVPNEKGLERALEAGVKSIAVFSATSDAFNQKNIGMSVKDSLEGFRKVVPAAIEKGLRVRGYVSTAFGCPYEGHQPLSRLMNVTKQLLEFGCYEVSVGDTIGVAHPKQVQEAFYQLQTDFGLERIAGHFHDTRGVALTNIRTALEVGVRTFDASVGGLGGCPYATGSSGNVATEEVAWLLEGEGMKTGIEIPKLLEVAAWVESKIGRPLKSKLYLSKPQKLYYFS